MKIMFFRSENWLRNLIHVALKKVERFVIKVSFIFVIIFSHVVYSNLIVS